MKNFFAPAVMSLLFLLASAEIASARDIGFGVGIGFPYGRYPAVSRAENYAALSFDKIIEELTVTEKSGRLIIEFKITNDSDEDYSLSHRDGQEYEMAIFDKNGKALWLWSEGTAFTQALTETVYKHHDFTVYKAEIERKDYKKFKDDAVLVTAFLTDTNYKISTRLPHIERSSSGALHGTIIIGSGPYHDY